MSYRIGTDMVDDAVRSRCILVGFTYPGKRKWYGVQQRQLDSSATAAVPSMYTYKSTAKLVCSPRGGGRGWPIFLRYPHNTMAV